MPWPPQIGEPPLHDNAGSAEDRTVPFIGRFVLSRAELVADGIVQGTAVAGALVGGVALLWAATDHTGPGEYAAAVLYVVSLLAVLTISLIYNLWPISPTKWLLRRFDHAAIYLLIAGSYTPFLAQLKDAAVGWMVAAVVWGGAVIGMALKLFLPGRLDRLAVLFCLAIGWSGVAVADHLFGVLPPAAITLLAAGGIAYSLGTVFFIWHSLPFQTALWHGFVVIGATLHFAAVTDLLVVARLA